MLHKPQVGVGIGATRRLARYLDRLRAGTPATIETSNLHQEVVRSLKQINTAFSLVAYPIAEETGDLLSSRLAGAQSAGR